MIEQQIKQTIDDMSQLYIMFCMPRITTKTTGEIVSVEYVWTNKDAEETYNILQKNLSYYYQIDLQRTARPTRAD